VARRRGARSAEEVAAGPAGQPKETILTLTEYDGTKRLSGMVGRA
jgi:hypothetical protein